MRALPLDIRKREAAQARARVGPLAVAVALGAAAAATRLPFVRETPINWDGIQFVLALSRFDLHDHQPHPPGYILYVLAGRALDALVGNPSVALSYLSVICTALAVPLIYLLALRIFDDEAVAAGAALILMASPLVLYYGSVGLTYMPEMALGLAVAGLAWRVRDEAAGTRLPVLLGVALGIAGGIRQSTLLLLLPLCAWALWGSSLRRWALSVVPLAATCLLWLVPLLYLSGGLEAYLRENALLAARVSSKTSLVVAGPWGAAQNLAFEALALGTGLAFALVPLGLWALRALRFSLSRSVRSFFIWWIAPALAFFSVSHVGQYGYVLVVLPPLVMLSAVCVRVLVEPSSVGAGLRSPLKDRFGSSHLSAAVCAAIALASGAYFLLAQGPTTGPAITQNDIHWRAVRSALSSMNPAGTVLVSSARWTGSFRAAGYLLPEFRTYGAGENPDDHLGWLYSAQGGRSTYALPVPPAREYLPLPSGTRQVVILDEEIAEKFAEQESLRRVALPDGYSLYILTTPQVLEALAIQQNILTASYKRK